MVGDRLFDDATVTDPFPYFAELREQDPVHEVDRSGVFLVTRMELIKQIAADTETFSNHYLGFIQRGDDDQPYVLPLGRDDTADMQYVLATADPPDHARHRRVMQARLSPTAIETLVPTLRTFADALLADGVRDGRIEWMSAFAEQLPMRAIARLLEVPDATIPQMLEFGYASGERISGLATRERLAELDQIAYEAAGKFVLDTYAQRGTRGDSLVGDVFAAVERGEINEMEALAMLTVVVIAGGESTTSLIGNAALILATDAALQQRLRDDPALIPAFVEEALRVHPSFRNHYRLVTTDTELAGVRIPRGSHLALLWPAANRDPDAFKAPDTIDIHREKPRSHVGFGWGIHLCIGAPLARAEARIAIETLLEQTTSVELDTKAEPPEYVPSLMVRRLRNLPLALHAGVTSAEHLGSGPVAPPETSEAPPKRGL